MSRFHVCVCYVVTTLLLSAFLYTMISGNIYNSKKLDRLQEEMDEIAHVILSNVASKGDSRHLSAMIDNLVKERLTAVWDDLYTIKKQIKAQECPTWGMGVLGRFMKDTNALAKIDDRVNYASESLGAKIVAVKAYPVCPSSIIKSIFGMEYSANPPAHILRPSMEPGNCFAFKNDKAEVTIQLPHEITIDLIALQHIGKNKSPTENTSSAPKDFSVYGVKAEKESLLGKFRYENSPNKELQLFNIKTEDKHNVVRFQFETNHGHANYTCIYRVAVYGKL